jgi:hypothetical protein
MMHRPKEKAPRSGKIEGAKMMNRGKPSPRTEICQPFFNRPIQKGALCNLTDSNLSPKAKTFLKALLDKKDPRHLRAGDFLTTKDLAWRFDQDHKTTRARIKELVRLGYATGAQAGKFTVWIFSNIREFNPQDRLDRTLLKLSIRYQKHLQLDTKKGANYVPFFPSPNTITKKQGNNSLSEREKSSGSSPSNIIQIQFNQKGNQMNEPSQGNLFDMEEKPKPPKEPSHKQVLREWIIGLMRKHGITYAEPNWKTKIIELRHCGLMQKMAAEWGPGGPIPLRMVLDWAIQDPRYRRDFEYLTYIKGKLPFMYKDFDREIMKPSRDKAEAIEQSRRDRRAAKAEEARFKAKYGKAAKAERMKG